MKCPYCREMESRVIESRYSDDGESIRRRRECSNCKRRFTTYERIEVTPLLVVKKGGNREQFSRDKLAAGILKACEKRPVTMEDIERVVGDIERELRDKYDREVTSMVIGEKVMDELRSLDKVAYVRFASVYREFADLDGFIQTIEQLQRGTSTEEER
ncbi:MAG TPA: transcriptional repressor NrdR [Syntrophothermus lipocalidus]|uniref:Transcriptional repressor NrdR n=1 Tax=Syntrophothermus lipocalidus (strain DSM 12680 / TGB-C1) TaxID=643648 RepID=D7CLK6_SYNLT|nr:MULTISPECIES: transcriptional regulator NrdR [Syntrophothermus]ADI01591.1 ATP-cone domain protein [Syntrophothermus lipocalidus DSM 12680]NSW83963.1 transcriptional repressor NrdR [Syntrophothermus sp.]HHV76988.1 transcriptional repressor NrdR [Syntrophothermus lipocalidus]